MQQLGLALAPEEDVGVVFAHVTLGLCRREAWLNQRPVLDVHRDPAVDRLCGKQRQHLQPLLAVVDLVQLVQVYAPQLWGIRVGFSAPD
jgi:hypothetical protein